MQGRFNLRLNSEWVLRDAQGNVKPVFQPNALMTNLIRWGLLSPKAPKISGLFGKWANSMQVSNLVTDAGKAGVAGCINGSGFTAHFTQIAVGTGVTAANAADTTLETELAASGLSRAAGAVSRVTTDVANDSARIVVVFTVTGTAAVTESGVLNAAAAGVLLARQVFSAINVISGDSLSVTWTFDVD